MYWRAVKQKSNQNKPYGGGHNYMHIYMIINIGLHDIPWFWMFATGTELFPVQPMSTWLSSLLYRNLLHNLSRNTTKPTKWVCAQRRLRSAWASAQSDQSLCSVRVKKPWILSYPLCAQRRLWSDWADAQADLSLGWEHSHFVGFVMSRLFFFSQNSLWLADISSCAYK